MKKFKDKNIIITGGSRGIGRATAILLAGLGANIFLVARNKQDLEETQKEINDKYPTSKCIYAQTDVTEYDQVKNTVDTAVREMGEIHGLINNAGAAYPQYFQEIPISKFEESVRLNYLGSVYFAHALYPYLREGAFVCFTSSVVGFMGVFGYSSYAGPKWALIGLAETLRQEFAPRKIQVSVLCPPDTDTPGFEVEEKTKPFETSALSESAKIMSPEDVARKFIKKLARKKFLINVNFESALFYRLHGWFPELVQSVMNMMIGSAQKKKKKSLKTKS
jgi:3-dehydrosphinganine reductase